MFLAIDKFNIFMIEFDRFTSSLLRFWKKVSNIEMKNNIEWIFWNLFRNVQKLGYLENSFSLRN